MRGIHIAQEWVSQDEIEALEVAWVKREVLICAIARCDLRVRALNWTGLREGMVRAAAARHNLPSRDCIIYGAQDAPIHGIDSRRRQGRIGVPAVEHGNDCAGGDPVDTRPIEGESLAVDEHNIHDDVPMLWGCPMEPRGARDALETGDMG